MFVLYSDTSGKISNRGKVIKLHAINFFSSLHLPAIRPEPFFFN